MQALPDDDGEMILKAERQALRKRRGAWGLDGPGNDMTGLALSGGGIRSATFSLGVLRELSALGLLARFDYLSTVSGGSYVGAFLCGLFVPRGDRAAVVRPGKRIEDPLGEPDARGAIGLLRQSGRYLAPTGTLDYWYALTILTRNWIGVHLLIGSTVFGIALIGIVLRALGMRYGLQPGPPAAIALGLAAVTLSWGWAYWLTWRDVGSLGSRGMWALFGSIALIAVCFALGWREGDRINAGTGVAAIGTLALAIWLFNFGRIFRTARWQVLAWKPSADLEEAWDRARMSMTRTQSILSRAACAIGVFALVDALAFSIAGSIDSWALGAPPLATLVLVPVARALLARTDAVRAIVRGALRRFFARTFVTLVAALLAILTVGFWEVLAYRIAWPMPAPAQASLLLDIGAMHATLPAPPPGGGAASPLESWESARALLAASVVTLILATAMQGSATFLNLSSLATFYAGRLRRAYLGAGNRARLEDSIGVEKGEADDEIQLIDYYGKAPGAPLHLIGITLNQTIGRGSEIVQRDRHGRNITLGPAGISISQDDGNRRTLIGYGSERQEERLPLSTWIGISGASFSTGLGGRTGFGLSMLAGLANVRLGYWWRAGLAKPDRSVQCYLFDEILGQFAGTERRRWYLSDGGHFENSAVYELIRRRLPFILASDNGQDETYAYEDIANLVRKARIDFGAEIAFLDSEALDMRLGRGTAVRRAFGTLAQIGGAEPPAPGAVAALATITYDDASRGTLVLIKPRLTGDGPADLMRYKAENAAFPQQTTLDQFFDEAQWESYYTLGRHITRSVMAPRDARWSPGDLTPLGPSSTGRTMRASPAFEAKADPVPAGAAARRK